MKNAFIVMIPTVDRVDSLIKVISSCENLENRPIAVAICVSGGKSVEQNITNNLSDLGTSFTVSILQTDIRSSSQQRNILLEFWANHYPEVDFGLFLDDDTVPASDYASRLLRCLEVDESVGGCSGVTFPPVQQTLLINATRAFGRLFFLHGKDGNVLRSGVNVPIRTKHQDPQKAEWLFGCSMWRGQASRSARFNDEWVGYAIGEDVDFSLQVSRNWNLMVDPHALLHSVPNFDQLSSAATIRDEIVHRLWIVENRWNRRSGDLICFHISSIGLLLHAICSLLMIRPLSWQRLRGVIHGIIDTSVRHQRKAFGDVHETY